MNIKCPYCGCCYDVSTSVLKDPIENEKLGYGWWLRCCRCQKKWWLKNSFVEENFNSPLKANKQDKINRLGKLLNKKKPKKKEFKFTKSVLLKCIGGLVLLGALYTGYSFRGEFISYITMKAQNLRENIKSKLELVAVRYTLNEDNSLQITGGIVNTDNRNILRVNGIRITVYSNNTQIDTWNLPFEDAVILPSQQIPFSSKKVLSHVAQNIDVEVSIY